MTTQLNKGQRFTWKVPATMESGQAVVDAIRTDGQEGLSPESEDYASLWVEAQGIQGSREGQRFTVLFATDGRSYLDGQELQLQIVADKG